MDMNYKYKLIYSSQFKKDFKKFIKSGRYDPKKLEIVVELLCKGDILPAKYRNHRLKGNFMGASECHIEPDWLLIYEKLEDTMVLYLMRTGSHGQLFG